MDAQSPMHRHTEALVDAVAGVITRHILDRTRPQDAGAVQRSEMEQHLVESHEIRRGTVASATRHARSPERWAVTILEQLVLPALGALICARQSIVQRIRHTDTQAMQRQ